MHKIERFQRAPGIALLFMALIDISFDPWLLWPRKLAHEGSGGPHITQADTLESITS